VDDSNESRSKSGSSSSSLSLSLLPFSSFSSELSALFVVRESSKPHLACFFCSDNIHQHLQRPLHRHLLWTLSQTPLFPPRLLLLPHGHHTTQESHRCLVLFISSQRSRRTRFVHIPSPSLPFASSSFLSAPKTHLLSFPTRFWFVRRFVSVPVSRLRLPPSLHPFTLELPTPLNPPNLLLLRPLPLRHPGRTILFPSGHERRHR